GHKRRDIGLGGYPDISLTLARERARAAREKIWQGLDPVTERREVQARLKAQQSNEITFDDAARRFLAVKTSEFRNAKHADQWAATLKTYASPKIGKLPVSGVDLHGVVSVLEPIWTEKTETASRLRGRIESILAWATVHGYRSGDNPARWRGHLDAVLPKPSKVAKADHHPALQINAMPEFMRALRQRDGLGARALELAIITAARSGEVRGARWHEIDMTSKVWIVPAERMKANREHRVPLSPAAMRLLKNLPR
ncbi:unnamed protein product, partial [Phaeothamnion confervicola]